MSAIVTLCLSAGIQKTISFDSLKPGAVNRSRSYIYDASGKAVNSARVLTQLMELDAADKTPAAPDDVTLICPLGKKNADFFLQLAARDSLNPEAVLIPGYTRECCTLLDDATGEVTELVVEEPTPEGDAPVSDLLFTLRTALARASAFCAPTDKAVGTTHQRTALLFAGSRSAFWPQDVITQIALAAKKAGALFMADFRGDDLLRLLDSYATPVLTPDIIKINEAEFRETFMQENGADDAGKTETAAATGTAQTKATTSQASKTDSLATAICEKSRELGNIIVVTRGADSTLAAERGTLYECASEKVRVVNTIGCGDSFNAGFLFEFLTSGDVACALEKGTWCAARNAERLSPGTIK